MPVRGGDRQEAPAAGATARKPMPAYSEWPDEALKLIKTQLWLCIRHAPYPAAGKIRIEALTDEHLRRLEIDEPIGLHRYPVALHLTDAANDERRIV